MRFRIGAYTVGLFLLWVSSESSANAQKIAYESDGNVWYAAESAESEPTPVSSICETKHNGEVINTGLMKNNEIRYGCSIKKSFKADARVQQNWTDLQNRNKKLPPSKRMSFEEIVDSTNKLASELHKSKFNCPEGFKTSRKTETDPNDERSEIYYCHDGYPVSWENKNSLCPPESFLNGTECKESNCPAGFSYFEVRSGYCYKCRVGTFDIQETIKIGSDGESICGGSAAKIDACGLCKITKAEYSAAFKTRQKTNLKTNVAKPEEQKHKRQKCISDCEFTFDSNKGKPACVQECKRKH